MINTEECVSESYVKPVGYKLRALYVEREQNKTFCSFWWKLNQIRPFESVETEADRSSLPPGPPVFVQLSTERES